MTSAVSSNAEAKSSVESVSCLTAGGAVAAGAGVGSAGQSGEKTKTMLRSYAFNKMSLHNVHI